MRDSETSVYYYGHLLEPKTQVPSANVPGSGESRFLSKEPCISSPINPPRKTQEASETTTAIQNYASNDKPKDPEKEVNYLDLSDFGKVGTPRLIQECDNYEKDDIDNAAIRQKNRVILMHKNKITSI